MQKLCLFLNWFFIRPWPLWVTVLLMVAILVVGLQFGKYRRNIFTVGGMLMQGAGVLVLLFILNQNMAALQGGSLLSEANEWLRNNPLISRSAKVELVGQGGAIGGGSATVKVHRHANTDKERIKILEEEIEIIKNEVVANRTTLEKRIDENTNRVTKRIDDLDTNVHHVEEKLVRTVIGDFRWPVFSALIILAGLFISLVPLFSRDEGT